MAMKIYGPGDFIPDNGEGERLYPIPEKVDPDLSEILYDRHVQQISYVTANLVSVFTEWFTSFFEPHYFKFIRIKTQSTITEFKSFMMDIYKKDKPFLVIDPRPVEVSEDTLFTHNMLGRYNLIDPEHDNIGAKLVYALTIAQSDLFELKFRRNQYTVQFDAMIMEQTLNRQFDTYNSLIMNMRHNSQFMLERTVPMLIPTIHIRNIATFHGYDWQSNDFLNYLNSISQYPIIKRTLGNGREMFYFEYPLHIQVISPGLPARDGPENSEAIEWGARVVDSFTFKAIMPGEFVFLTKKEYVGLFDRGIEEDPETITYISPIMTDLPWPKEIGEYKMTNQFDVDLQEGDDPKLQVLPLIRSYNEETYKTIMDYIGHGLPLEDLVVIRVWPNGSFQEIGSILHQNGVLELTAPELNKLYTARIYVNLRIVNLVREGGFKQFIGTIEKY